MLIRILYLYSLILLLFSPVLLAQNNMLTGKVTDANSGVELQGATVFIIQTEQGAVVDLDGNYEITSIPDGVYTIRISFIGYRTKTVNDVVIEGDVSLDFVLDRDLLNLEEVVVTGVSGVTPQRNLAFTVDRIGERELQAVPAVSASSSLQGKMPGVSVIQNSGMPGTAASIRLRGSTALIGDQSPLIIVDGVLLDESLVDIDALDIESIEVLKGASAASLYGSRAANGVVSIRTRRGQYLPDGAVQVTIRNEFGRSSIARELPWNNSHHYELDESGDFVLDSGGNRVPNENYISDQPYPESRNLQRELFEPGNFMTNYISLLGNTGRGNYALSFNNTHTEGILFGVSGYSRQNLRFNLDQNFGDNLRLSTSTAYSTSNQEPVPQGPGSPFFRVLMLQPNADIYGTNPDGSRYNIRPDPQVSESNPLYQLANQERDNRRQRFLGDIRLNYNPLDWLSFEGSYSIDRVDFRNSVYTPKGFWQISGNSVAQGNGSLTKANGYGLAQTAIATATLRREFRSGINTRFRASYQFENREYDETSASGSNFSVGGIPRLNLTDQDTRSTQSFQTQIKTENVFGILDMDYRERYIISALLRRDGSSEFGADQRYSNYYRISGAYRITEDLSINGIQELKVRASLGTAGLRPPFQAQYETYSLSGGAPSPGNLGNRDLRPAFSKELELGVDVEFLNRFDLTVNYSNQETRDQIVLVPLSARAGGFNAQWQNAGTLEAKTFEVSLGAIIMDSPNLQWTANLNFDRIRQTVTQLNFPPRFVGPNLQSNAVFYLNEGEPFGIMYGRRWVRSFEELQRNPAFEGANPQDYIVNSDGFLILAGTEGTPDEEVIRYFEVDENGDLVGDFRIGDVNPDFNISLSQNIDYKNWSFYALLDAQVGGEIYNLTKQWIFRELRHGDIDQRGKPEGERKAVQYYNSLYDANNTNEYFVEDASYLKLREVAVNYTFRQNQLGRFGNMFNSIRVGMSGRNLLTLTRYSGFDPEVSGLEGDVSNYRIDSYAYPNYRTITGVIEFTF
jgi:TonB-linked SusC/RagA family outer membrane protein